MDRDEVEAIKMRKKNVLSQYPTILTSRSLNNSCFLIEFWHEGDTCLCNNNLLEVKKIILKWNAITLLNIWNLPIVVFRVICALLLTKVLFYWVAYEACHIRKLWKSPDFGISTLVMYNDFLSCRHVKVAQPDRGPMLWLLRIRLWRLGKWECSGAWGYPRYWILIGYMEKLRSP